MKTLALLPRVVFPADTGAKIRNLNMFRRLSEKGDEATIVCYRSAADTDSSVEQMRGICSRLELVQWDEVVTFSPQSYLMAAKNLASRDPYAVGKYWTPQLQQRVDALLRQERFDCVIADTVVMAPTVMRSAFTGPTLCFEHNVEFVIRRRQYQKARNPLLKGFLYYDYLRLKAFERSIGESFDHLIMVSKNDCETMASELGITNTSEIPLGVDVDFFSPPTSDSSEDSLDLVFTGSMDWLPNEDGLCWFLEEVLPLVQRRVPARLWIVGRRPSARIKELAQKAGNVEITGWVDDVRPFVTGSAIFVVPLRIGGGTRIKIFEGMAMAKAVVSTTIGAEGLPVHHGEDVILSDTAESFAEDLVALLADPPRRKVLGLAARKLVVDHYSWENAADVFAEICRRVVAAHGGH